MIFSWKYSPLSLGFKLLNFNQLECVTKKETGLIPVSCKTRVPYDRDQDCKE